MNDETYNVGVLIHFFVQDLVDLVALQQRRQLQLLALLGQQGSVLVVALGQHWVLLRRCLVSRLL